MKRLVVFVVVALAAVVLGTCTEVGAYFNQDAIRRLADALGWGGPAVIILAGLVTPILFLPRWPIALVSGALYGIVLGSLVANVASTLGALLNFVLAKSLLAPSADRLRERYRLTRLKVPRERAFAVLFLLRAFPLSNFVATNLVAGALKIHLGTYLTATFLGMIPSTVMYAAWGKLVKKPSSPWFYAVAAFTLFLIVTGTIVAQKRLLPWFRELGIRTAPPDAEEEDGGGKPA
jgi:uncharacterized membrane protein YdjX (TVP38/TMEM64 family)